MNFMQMILEPFLLLNNYFATGFCTKIKDFLFLQNLQIDFSSYQ